MIKNVAARKHDLVSCAVNNLNRAFEQSGIDKLCDTFLFYKKDKRLKLEIYKNGELTGYETLDEYFQDCNSVEVLGIEVSLKG